MIQHLLHRTKHLCLLLALLPLFATAQTAYCELQNSTPTPTTWNEVRTLVAGLGSTDVRYAKECPVAAAEVDARREITAWRGERVSALFVVSTPTSLPAVSVTASSPLAPKKGLRLAPVRYIMTDELNKDGAGACGHRRAADFDSSLVADVIDLHATQLDVAARTTQTFWFSFDVPARTKPGTYTFRLTARTGTKQVLATSEVVLHVKPHVLPKPEAWHFHLDLWQNPYAEAAYYGVEPFSKEHFRRMRPEMKHYAEAGGKVITTTITDRPWDGQTYTPFGSMVEWTKRADGTWSFDFARFDAWVEYMMSLGVREQINCYSMVPWRLRFPYFDEATQQYAFLEAAPADAEYAAFWTRMLRAFALHLRAKGWMQRTCIAMDERPMPVMLQTLRIIRDADPSFKVSLAGTYHDELVGELYDYCVGIAEADDEFLAKRRAHTTADAQDAPRVSTFYTCCTEPRPNTFTFSAPAEAEWLGWFAAAHGFDGYLRWALNSWTAAPLHDSRFRSWAAGDTYLLYPDGRSSVRFERLREGIQAYEKLRILQSGAQAEAAEAFRQQLSKTFLFPLATPEEATRAVREARAEIDRF